MIHIVGAKGIIGAHLLKQLQTEDPISVFDSGNWNFATIAQGDIVFYLRAISSPYQAAIDPKTSYDINVIRAQMALQDLINRGARIVFASSDVVYGETGGNFAKEETPRNPYGEYAKQKARIEAAFEHQPNFLSLRISSVLGEGSNLQKLLLSQQSVEIFDPVIRTPIHINDLVAICTKLLKIDFRSEFPNGVLNVGGGTSMSNFEIAILEAKFLGVKRPVVTSRSELDKTCRPGTVRMDTTKAAEFVKLSLDVIEHYE